jgi:predicted DNA-binding protein (MmcQ/YjbR family)
MDIESLRNYCLSKPGAEETEPFGPNTLVYKVGGKIFLLFGIDSVPLQFNAKCDPEKVIELRERYDCVQPGYHMNKKHWNTVIVDGSVSDTLLKEWIDDSYQLIVESLPAKAKAQLKSK